MQPPRNSPARDERIEFAFSALESRRVRIHPDVGKQFLSMYADASDQAALDRRGTEQMLLSYGSWLLELRARRVRKFTDRAVGLAVIDIETGQHYVLFGLSGDLTRATIGPTGGGNGVLRETDVWRLVPWVPPDGDSSRPASSRWLGEEQDEPWLLVHKGYVNESEYGHLRTNPSDEEQPEG